MTIGWRGIELKGLEQTSIAGVAELADARDSKSKEVLVE
jgi:hypothetical protein